LSGSGTSNYIAKFTDSKTIGDSVIYENGGKVGIGTAAPTAPLTIQAGIGPDVEFTSSGSNADIMASTILRVGTLTASNFHIMTNNQYRMSVDSSGNVGVGTDSPSAKLDVQGAVQVGQNGTGYDVSYYGAYSGGRLFWDPSKMALRAGRASGTEWNDANVGFYSLGIGSGVTVSGNWSSGTGEGVMVSGPYSTAMGQGLNVSGGYSAAIGRYLDAGPGGSAFVIGSGVNNSTRLTNDMDNCLMVGFNSTIPTLFVGPSSGAGTTGNVGIGTTGPEEMLDVRGNIEVDQKIKAHDSGGLELATDEGTTRLFIEDSGNVGIGTTNPSEELDVVGTIFSTDPDPSGRAIQGNCSGENAYGVLGFSYGANGKSVYGAAVGTNGIAICGLASENATQAGYFDGDVHTTGKITKAFTSGTSNLATPIAYAFVSSDGVVAAGTPNVSASWNSGYSRYEITIDGESYSWTHYITTVTVASNIPYIATTSSMSGKLLIYVHDLGGSVTQAALQFVTYKP
jgi:hypothetical protein